MRRKASPERDYVQKPIATWLDWCLIPPYRYSAIGHGVPLSLPQARELKEMGLKPGLGDIQLWGPDRWIAWLECKYKTPQSPAQRDFQAYAESVGHLYEIVHSIDEAAAALKRWGVPTREHKPTPVDALRAELEGMPASRRTY